LLVCLFAMATGTFAQVSGVVKDDKGKPLPGVTISLNRSRDSAIVKLNVTDAGGNYMFNNLNEGNYFISLSCMGYAAINSKPFAVNAGMQLRVPGLIMTATLADLKTVVVTDRKPMIEVKSDRTIFNVENSINAAGQTALELLRKSPGVVIDKDDNINLNGKNGVQIFIDGRPTPLTDKDLSDYLKSLQSADIEAIEIISNPSAKYEAAGNGGIINIRLKKNKTFGSNGSVTTGYNISNFSKYNGGIVFNHRNQSLNLFGNYTYSNITAPGHFDQRREELDSLFDQHSIIPRHTIANNFKTGLDYFIDKKSTVGIIINGALTKYFTNTSSNTLISYVPTNTPERLLVANNTLNAIRNNININTNYHYARADGSELSLDADYGNYKFNTEQLQPNVYYDPSGKTLLYSDKFDILSPTGINIYSFKTDFVQPLKKGRLDIGIKLSYVKSDNDFQQYRVLSSVKIFDTLNSSAFNYRENINAGYFNYNRQFKSWVIQAGLRIENTIINGFSNGYKPVNNNYLVYDSSFKRNYTDLFPGMSVTYNKDPLKQWVLSYSRRIDRPAYRDLNPFEFKLDEYTFQKGNTGLRPQYTNSTGLTYIYKYNLVITLNYSHIQDVFTQLIDTTGGSKAFLIKQNLATQDITSLNISYPVQYKWYGLHFNLNSFYTIYKADFGPGRTINLDVYAFTFFHQQTFNLGKGITAEVSGYYNSPSIQQGTFKTKAVWTLDAGMQKNVLDKNGTVKISVSDIFRTIRYLSVSNFAGQVVHTSARADTRQLRLFFTYRFGNKQVKAARQHASGAEEESSRVGAKSN